MFGCIFLYYFQTFSSQIKIFDTFEFCTDKIEASFFLYIWISSFPMCEAIFLPQCVCGGFLFFLGGGIFGKNQMAVPIGGVVIL